MELSLVFSSFGITDGNDKLQMINEQVVPELREICCFTLKGNGWFQRLWWIQDGASPHRRWIVSERLEQLCGNRDIALNHPVEWPPRSPDLTLLDFFLWGYLKSTVYATPPANLDKIEARIQHEMDTLKQNRQMVHRVIFSMRRRARLCMETVDMFRTEDNFCML